ncbi:hypothetical protein GXM_06375 [Nostoc sphaeroides CCNUC1]|uniref:Uncharacterized protein n=1 Tax=Nostoc sphaeroides CCNUC1 TaxID=2653204 RepID=A0A5P8W8J7_9NOSO|nr:hypothetical protein GXM_06375 [Nostoc sphaeroides CCNUC1]
MVNILNIIEFLISALLVQFVQQFTDSRIASKLAKVLI